MSFIQIGNSNCSTRIDGQLKLTTMNHNVDSYNNLSELYNTSTPVYGNNGGAITPYFYNSSANIYYQIDNDTITSSNGGFLLWGTKTTMTYPELIFKNGNTLLSNPTRIQYKSVNTTYDFRTNNCSFFVFYNNVSYAAIRTIYDPDIDDYIYSFDSNGQIIIKINGIKVPIYIKEFSSEPFLYYSNAGIHPVFVQYTNNQLNVSTNSSVNYYRYNFNSSHLELISDPTQIGIRYGNVAERMNGWNTQTGELTFPVSYMPIYKSNYQYNVTDLNYINNLTLNIGLNTKFIKIGNSNGITSFDGTIHGIPLSANKYISFSVNTENPTTTNRILGSQYTGSAIQNTSLTSTYTSYSNITSLPLGVYFLNAQTCLSPASPTLLSWCCLAIGSAGTGTTSASENYGYSCVGSGITTSNASKHTMSISKIIYISTANSTIHMNMKGGPAIANLVAGSTFVVTRIA